MSPGTTCGLLQQLSRSVGVVTLAVAVSCLSLVIRNSKRR